jgi:hypothetical protein
MFVDQCLCGIPEKKLRYDEKTNIFLAVKSLLQNMATVAVRCKVDDTAPSMPDQLGETTKMRGQTSCKKRFFAFPQQSMPLLSSAEPPNYQNFERSLVRREQ